MYIVQALEDNLLERHTPSSTLFIKNSIQMLERTSVFAARLFHVVSPTTEKAGCCIFKVCAKGTSSSRRDGEQRFLQAAKPEIVQSCELLHDVSNVSVAFCVG